MAMYGSPSVGLILVGGYSLVGAKVQGLTTKTVSAMERTDGLGDAWEESTPTGMKMATFTQEGAFFDDATAGFHDAFVNALTGIARVGTIAFAGSALGDPFVGFEEAIGIEYEVLGRLGNLTKANVAYTISGVKDEGVILQTLEEKTADWNTEAAGGFDYTTDTTQQVIPITSNSIANPTVVTTTVPHGLTSGDLILIAGVATSDPTINGAQTATVISTTTFSVVVNVTTGGTGGTVVRANSQGGGAAYQHVTAFSGFTGYVGKVVDSADDATYADLATFTNVTATAAAERVVVAGNVDRYLAVDGNVTGTGAITVCIGFARR